MTERRGPGTTRSVARTSSVAAALVVGAAVLVWVGVFAARENVESPDDHETRAVAGAGWTAVDDLHGIVRSRSELPPTISAAASRANATGQTMDISQKSPWWNWAKYVDCVAEVQLAVPLAERFNTEDGESPLDEGAESPAWATFIPLRFDVLDPIWCSEDVGGLVVKQERQLWAYPTPTPELRVGNQAPWLIRPETAYSSPTGMLAVVLWPTDHLTLEQNPDYFFTDEFLLELADDLSVGGESVRYAKVYWWFEYVGMDAVGVYPEQRVLPISDLQSEVHEALVLAGKE